MLFPCTLPAAGRPLLAPQRGLTRWVTTERIFNVRALQKPALCRRHEASYKAQPSITCLASQVQKRSKKTKSTVTLQELPQGPLPLEPLALEDEAAPTYPTVVLQARKTMRAFENCVLLTRVGGFYELYFEHADKFGPLLNLKVAQKKTNAGMVSMAGFPFFQLDRYLKLLVQDFNRQVAIAEEFPNSAARRVKTGGLMHDRKVARIVTAGTLIDEEFMDPFSNNYVLAIHIPEVKKKVEASESWSALKISLAWLDLSTGHFFTQSSNLNNLPSFLARVGPKEIVLSEILQTSKDHEIFTKLAEDCHLVSFAPDGEVRAMSSWSSMLESPVPVESMADFTPEEVAAGSALLNYVENRLQGSDMKLQPPCRQLDVMAIDKPTMRALEIKKTIREDTMSGSLLHTIRGTVTKGGARLLERWLSSPSTSIDEINGRLDLVTQLLEDEQVREQVVSLLQRTHDSHRLLQKFTFGRGDPDDLLALAGTIYATHDIVSALKQADALADCIHDLVSRIYLEGPMAMADRIKESIDEEGVTAQHHIEDGEAGEMQALAQAIVETEGTKEDSILPPKRKKKPVSIRDHYAEDKEAWIMKPAASKVLERLHSQLSDLGQERLALTESLSERLGVTTLTLRFSPGLGYFCHIKGKDSKNIPLGEIRSVSSSKSTRSFYHPEWTSLAESLDQSRVHIRNEEQRIFHSLRADVIRNVIKLRRNGIALDELDVASSFAKLALDNCWTKPVLTNSTAHKIIGGRHPTVEASLKVRGRTFVANDMILSTTSQVLHFITGPNMAGKSTYLRQNALITILAQIGCYVPASFADIGIVDQIFSRVGSADNLYADQSTFMVEMVETSEILRRATQRSFVIMDEIGRGTTPGDGEAVAFAVLEYLVRQVGCRALFATHFHGAVDLIQQEGMKGVGYYCTDIEEFEKEVERNNGDAEKSDRQVRQFRYNYKMKEGVNRQSHALKVARLAKIPEEAIAVAAKVLQGKISSG